MATGSITSVGKNYRPNPNRVTGGNAPNFSRMTGEAVYVPPLEINYSSVPRKKQNASYQVPNFSSVSGRSSYVPSQSIAPRPSSNRQGGMVYTPNTGLRPVPPSDYAFRGRIIELNKADQWIRGAEQRSNDIFRAVPGLGGDNYAQGLGRALLNVPTSLTVGLGGRTYLAGMKGVATGEIIARGNGGYIVKDVLPKAGVSIVKSFDPRQPQGLVNIGLLGLGVKSYFTTGGTSSFKGTVTAKPGPGSPEVGTTTGSVLGEITRGNSRYSVERSFTSQSSTTKGGTVGVLRAGDFFSEVGRNVVRKTTGIFKSTRRSSDISTGKYSRNPYDNSGAQGGFSAEVMTKRPYNPIKNVVTNIGEITKKGSFYVRTTDAKGRAVVDYFGKISKPNRAGQSKVTLRSSDIGYRISADNVGNALSTGKQFLSSKASSLYGSIKNKAADIIPKKGDVKIDYPYGNSKLSAPSNPRSTNMRVTNPDSYQGISFSEAISRSSGKSFSGIDPLTRGQGYPTGVAIEQVISSLGKNNRGGNTPAFMFTSRGRGSTRATVLESPLAIAPPSYQGVAASFPYSKNIPASFAGPKSIVKPEYTPAPITGPTTPPDVIPIPDYPARPRSSGVSTPFVPSFIPPPIGKNLYPGLPGFRLPFGGGGSRARSRGGQPPTLFQGAYKESLISTTFNIRGSRSSGKRAAVTGIAIRPIVG